MPRRERQRRRRHNRGSSFGRVLLFATMLVGCGAALAVIGVVGWVLKTANSAPDISQLRPRDPGQVSEVFAAGGQRLGYISSDVLRAEVPGDRIPQVLKDATVAIEDRRFYQHGGVDYQGLVRAGVRDLFGGAKNLQGGSTLTMQLVDNVYLPERIGAHHNLRYKIIQAKLANQLEKRRSRPWILTQYLNDVDYGTVGGQTAVGVGAASQLFFDKPLGRIDLAQAALLAGLPQAPSFYNPFYNPGDALRRRHNVLEAMYQAHYITRAQADAAEAAPLEVKRNQTYQTKQEPYVFDYVKQALIQRFGLGTVERGGLKVYTTIDLAKQAEARQALLAHEGYPSDPAAALVSVDPSNGHIVAMATNSDYHRTNFNYAWQAQRQTGSSFKPFVMMTMMHDYDGDPRSSYYTSKFLPQGWLPGYPTYAVHTSELTYQGTISVEHAMTVSDNTVFAQLGVDLGMDKVDQIAHEMGITSPLYGTPAEAIGGLRIGVSPLQMADAYATLANGGSHIAPTAIAKVVFPDGHVVDLGNPPHNHVFSDGETYVADQVLKTVVTSGTGTAASYGCPAAGKTGTTSSYTDAWFVGYTPKLSTAVWVGYPNSTESMNDVNGLGPGFGGTLSAPIWHDFMQKASGGFCGDFPQPTLPWSGTAYFGPHSAASRGSDNGTSTSGSGASPSTGGATPSTTTGAATGTGPAATTPYSNPTLYAQPPQPPANPGAGSGSGSGSTSGGGGIASGSGGGGGGAGAGSGNSGKATGGPTKRK